MLHPSWMQSYIFNNLLAIKVLKNAGMPCMCSNSKSSVSDLTLSNLAGKVKFMK